jgi:hypothetical protein
MKRFTVVAVVFAVALVAGIGTATAGIPHYFTTVDATGTFVGPSTERFLEYGQVYSSKRRCRANRRMKMVANYPDGSRKVLDTGRSSSHGAYALVGDFEGAEGGRIRAAPKRIGRRGHRKVCDGGSVQAD